MPVSLKSRLDGNKQEVLEHARIWGIYSAMDKYQVKDYVSFKRFLEDETGDKNFGLHPLLGSRGIGAWAEDLLDAILSKFEKMEAEKQYLVNALHQVTLELEYSKGHEAKRLEPRIQQILAKCQV